LYNKLYVLKTK